MLLPLPVLTLANLVGAVLQANEGVRGCDNFSRCAAGQQDLPGQTVGRHLGLGRGVHGPAVLAADGASGQLHLLGVEVTLVAGRELHAQPGPRVAVLLSL